MQAYTLGLSSAYLILHNCAIHYVSELNNVREIYFFNV